MSEQSMTVPLAVGQLVKLSGVIQGLKRERGEASFVLTEGDRQGMGAIAIAAGLVGLGGQAIATASAAASAEETAESVSFRLGDAEVAGWLWRCPFREGDQVEVAAFWDGERYQLQAATRPLDGVVALYPHCSRGRATHRQNAIKWWVLFCSALTIVGLVAGVWVSWESSSKKAQEFLLTVLVVGAAFNFSFFGLMVYSLARKWMPFVRVAESAFRTLGWPNPESIDLVKSSKKLRKPDDPAEFGTFYFRYQPRSERTA